jgi:hypothetical protein
MNISTPTYPNALYLGHLSAFISIPGSSIYLYTTNDSIDEVVKFYQSKTGKKEVGDKNSYCFFVHDGLAIDVYNDSENQGKTVIRISASD